MKFVSILLIVFNTTLCFAQSDLSEIDIKVSNVKNSDAEAFIINEYQNNRYSLFLIESEAIHRILLDSQFQVLQEKSIPRPEFKYPLLIGYAVSLNHQHLVFANKAKKEFEWTTYYKVGQIKKEVTKIKLKNETFIEAVSDDDVLYMFTVNKGTSILNMYKFIGPNEYDVKSYDLSKYQFSTEPKLYYALRTNPNALKNTLSVQVIDNHIPNPIEITSKLNKLYPLDDRFIFTFDNFFKKTVVLTLYKDKDSYSLKEFQKYIPQGEDPLYVNTNSFVKDEYLYQLSVSKQEINLTIRDLVNGQIVKEYGAGKQDDIDFRNTEIIQEGGISIYNQNEEKELTKTKQALRKMYNSDIGVSIHSLGNRIEATIGGYKEVKQSAPMYMGPTLGPTFSVGSGMYMTVGVNPMMFGYNSYKNTRSVYFKSLFDSSFEHVPGRIPTNTFDNIMKYSEQLEKISMETIFGFEDKIIYGFYIKKEKKYYLKTFENNLERLK